MKLIKRFDNQANWVLVEASISHWSYFQDITITEYKKLLLSEHIEVMPHGIYELEDWKIDREYLRNGHELYLTNKFVFDKRTVKMDPCMSRLFRSISEGHTKIEDNRITVKGIFRKNGRVICLYPLINEDLTNG